MRLPGTRYQEHGWERVRKLLGACSLLVLQQIPPERLRDAAALESSLSLYTDGMAMALDQVAKTGRAVASGNSYGDSVVELAQMLVCELRALPGYWAGLIKALGPEHTVAASGNSDIMLRKRINDMFATLRDKVDADNYQVAQGRPCSPNKIYTYRMLDTARGEIARIFTAWQAHQPQIAAILGRSIDAMPSNMQRITANQTCRAEWIINWSASLEQFGAGPGPMHTKSKRFSSLKNNPQKIQLLLNEIVEYEALSANFDTASDWRHDAGQADDWLQDYWRVVQESEQAEAAADGCEAPDLLDVLLQADAALEEDEQDTDALPADERAYAAAPDLLENLAAHTAFADDEGDGDGVDAQALLTLLHNAGIFSDAVAPAVIADDACLESALSLPLGYIASARAAEDQGSVMVQILNDYSLAIRLALYWKELGAWDESYPDAWLDPATGELPTMKQLAGLDRISLPTLRKRRDDAIARLRMASALAAQQGATKHEAKG